MERFLIPSVRAELLRCHRSERDGRIKDRIKVVLLYDDGWSYASIAEALFLSEEGVRQQLKDYVESDGKKLKPGNGGSQTFLNIIQTKALTVHLENHLYLKVSDICAYVHKTYGIRYSVSGCTGLRSKDLPFINLVEFQPVQIIRPKRILLKTMKRSRKLYRRMITLSLWMESIQPMQFVSRVGGYAVANVRKFRLMAVKNV